MKVTDVLAQALVECGVKVVFGVSGGASLHIINSINNDKRLTYKALHHEQNAGMAADGVSRSTESLGCAVATSGPGATNLITAIAGSYYDSIATVFIVGQVSTNRQKGALKVRQIGFQETPIVTMVSDITKMTLTINASNVSNTYQLVSEAIEFAKEGRPGPILIEIPDDIQRMDIEFKQINKSDIALRSESEISANTLNLIELLVSNAKKPVLILGNGINLAHRRNEFQLFAKELNWPVLLTWATKDLMPWEQTNNVGTFGTHGTRLGNLVVQNSDLIIAFGARLDTKATGSPINTFAPNAKKIVFDIDQSELDKFGNWDLKIDLPARLDLASSDLDQVLKSILNSATHDKTWLSKIRTVKNVLESVPLESSNKFVNPYFLMETASELISTTTSVFVDTGCSVAWLMQSWRNSLSHRIYHDCNNTAMGWALPAGIGFATANSSSNALIIVGDGSLMMSLQDLSALPYFKSKLKIMILNNGGYSMIKQTQDQWFNGVYFSSNAGSDLIFPNFKSIANAFGIDYLLIDGENTLQKNLKAFFNSNKSMFCEVLIDSNTRVNPQVKFGKTIENMEPELSSISMDNILTILNLE